MLLSIKVVVIVGIGLNALHVFIMNRFLFGALHYSGVCEFMEFRSTDVYIYIYITLAAIVRIFDDVQTTRSSLQLKSELAVVELRRRTLCDKHSRRACPCEPNEKEKEKEGEREKQRKATKRRMVRQ